MAEYLLKYPYIRGIWGWKIRFMQWHRNMGDCLREKPVTPAKSCPVSNLNAAAKDEGRIQKVPLHALPQITASLGKIRLTALVSLTAIGGYMLAGADIKLVSLCGTVLGITFCSFAANTFNQYLEYPFDSQMSRTKSRVLPMGIIKPQSAFFLGLTYFAIGGSILYATTNPLSTALGCCNIILYAFVYTPLKRYSTLNTHVGSIVGSIPPVIGWTAATGSFDATTLTLALILYSWQFVHFNSLSWNLRADYCRAGYQMLAITNPQALQRSTLLHSFIILISTVMLPFLKLTTPLFLYTSLPINLITCYFAWNFYRHANANTAHKLFLLSLMQISVLMALIIVHYKNSIFQLENSFLYAKNKFLSSDVSKS